MKIVFLGDSITDVGRNVNNGSTISMGQGYPLIISAYLGARYPGKYEFVNSAVSGSRIVDIYARIKKDCWNLEPDVISILDGINDVWHELGDRNGVDAERYENVYRMLVSDTLKRFPQTRLMLLEPFVLKASATEGAWETFSTETEKRARIVKTIAKDSGQIFVPLQKPLEDACRKAPASVWLADGVHPAPAGHQLIADAWLKAFDEQIGSL